MIVASGDLYQFFLERLTPIAPDFSVEPTEAIYLARLLAERSQPQRGPATLFELYKRAVEEGGPAAVASYKEIGDRSLFLVGVFPEHLNRRRGVGERYYRNMGAGAYASLAGLLRDDRYLRLSHQFSQCVDTLRATMENVRWADEDDINDLYEKWLVGEDASVEKRVRKLGMPLKIYSA